MSTIFARIDIDKDKDFLKDLDIFSRIDIKSLNEFCSNIKEWLLDETEQDKEKFVEIISLKYDFTYNEAESAISFTRFLFRLFKPGGKAHESESAALVKDLIKAEAIDEKRQNYFVKAFDIVKNCVDEDYLNAVEKEIYRTQGLPSLTDIHATVNLRGIIRNSYKTKDKIESYLPDITGTIPMATIELTFSDDTPHNHVFFQIDPKSLKKLINHFIAIEKDLDAIKGC
jgi:hypothetical protein